MFDKLAPNMFQFSVLKARDSKHVAINKLSHLTGGLDKF